MPVQRPLCGIASRSSGARTASRAHLVLALALATLASASGCSRKIGDACKLSTDCSISADRLCDTTQPAGYCTQFNCVPNSCPSDSRCVRFIESTCSAPTQASRFVRTFCMATCDDDGDCRGDYRCADVNAEFGRTVVDVDPSSTKVCIVAVPSSAPLVSMGEPAICRAAAPGATSSDSGADARDAANASDTGDAAVADQAVEAPADAPFDAFTDALVDGSGEGSSDAATDGRAADGSGDAVAEGLTDVLIDGVLDAASLDSEADVAPLDSAASTLAD